MACVASRPIFVWLGLLATLLLPAPAKLLSHKQKCSLSLHVHWCGCAQGLWSGLSKKVPQEHLAASTVMRVVQLHAANTSQSSLLIRFCSIAPAVSLGSCSGSTSWSLLVLYELQAMLLLSTNAELLTHQNYKWQWYHGNRPTCTLHVSLPPRFYRQWFQTIQSQVVS